MSNQSEADRIKWGMQGGSSSKEARTRKITCPACGNKEATSIEKDISKMEFQCKICTTEFSITFDTGEDRMRESYMLAEDWE